MKRSGTFVLLVALLGLPTVSTVLAHEGDMPVSGTIKAIGEKELTIQAPGPKDLKVVLDEKTKFEKSGKSATAKDLKAGARVVVDVEKGQMGESLVAKTVKIGTESAIYTCPMHPEVGENAPGKCPKCGMNLEPRS